MVRPWPNQSGSGPIPQSSRGNYTDVRGDSMDYLKFFDKNTENIPAAVLSDLSELGHDACSVYQQGLKGTPDSLLRRVFALGFSHLKYIRTACEKTRNHAGPIQTGL